MPRRPPRPAVALLCAGLLLAGCGSQPPQSPPTGVDGLVVPTPSPSPADFVAGVSNRWLPLTPGRVRRYAVSGDDAVTQRTTTVLLSPRSVAGVTTTVVRTVDRTVDRGPAAGSPVDAFYAQDTAGNVWLFGVTGADGWRAGEDGAEAGLVVPAAPRVGDGFAIGAVGGHPVAVDTVQATDATYGDRTGLLRIERVDPGSGRTTELLYAPRTGLLTSAEIVGGRAVARLVGGLRPTPDGPLSAVGGSR